MIVSGLLGFAAVAICACAASCEDVGCYEDDRYANVTHYVTEPNLLTQEGISVRYDGDQTTHSRYARSFSDVLAEVDQRTDRVEQCLRRLYPDGKLPVPVIAEGHCIRSYFEPEVKRECMSVLIAPDSHYGCSGEQLFPCSVNPQLCIDKGLTITPECPCECRSTIQDNKTIVTTPDMHLYDAELIRLVTGCNMVWIEGLQECWNP